MKSQELPSPFSGRFALLITALAASLAPSSLNAADVTLTATNGFGTSSFASSLSWSDGLAPSADNNYFVASGFQLRTVADSVTSPFAGNSLTLGNNTTTGVLFLKNNTNAVVTIGNLTLNNGEIANGSNSAGSATTVTIAGGITLASSANANRINPGGSGRGIIVTAPISGGGALEIKGGGTATLSGTNTYTGATTVTAGTLSVSATNQFSDSAALSLATGTTLNLNYSGTPGTADTVGNFRINGINQAPGIWGRPGSIAALGATYESALITGDGLININTTASYYWDGTGTAWAPANAWTLEANNPAANPAVAPGATSTVLFGADGLVADQTVQLGGARALAGATFTSPVAFNFTGGGTNSTLTVGDSGITVNAGTFGTTFGSPDAGQQVALALNGAQTWTNQAGAPLTAVNGVGLGAATLTTAGSGGFIFSGALTGTGGLVKQGTGYLQLDGTNTFTGDKTVSQGSVTVSGDQSASTGTWTLNAGTVNFAFESHVVVAGGKSVTLGNTVSYHTLNVSGTVVNDGELRLQGASTVNLNSDSVWTQNGSLNLAPVWSFEDATLTVNSGATFTYAGAGVIVMNTSNGGGNADDKTFLKISGGTFTTGQGFQNSTVGGNGSANLIISNGGTLKLSADVATLATTANRPFNVQVGSGGGIVDTAGFSATVTQGISGVGGLTKAGAGTLTTTGVNSYTGDTTVTGGILSVAGPTFDDASAVTIESGAKLDLNFAGTDTVASLTINGTSLPAGVYSASTHAAFITGTGTLTVPGGATPGFATWASGLGLSGNPDADFDKDGIADAAEYVLGTNPKAASSAGISGQKSGSDFVFTFSRSDDSETSDTTLTVEAGTTLGTWPQSFTIGATTGASSAGVVITENGAAADTVVVTIPTSAAAKLFAHLKVAVTP